jgi:hypothetical protein
LDSFCISKNSSDCQIGPILAGVGIFLSNYFQIGQHVVLLPIITTLRCKINSATFYENCLAMILHHKLQKFLHCAMFLANCLTTALGDKTW